MEFLAPGLLGLSALAALPVIVHLLFRPKPKVQPFPTIALLKRSMKRTRAYRRIRHWMLLAVRVAVVLLFVWALARPMIGGASHFFSGAPVAAAIVLDDSYRMTYAPGGQSRFERARKLALDVLHGLPAGSDVCLILPARGDCTGVESSTAIDGALSSATPSARTAPLGPAIERAWTELSGVQGRDREVYCISDMSESAWEGGVPRLEKASANDRLYLLDAGSDGPRNAAVVGVKVQPTCPVANEPVEVAATVKWTGDPTPRAAEVILDGQKKGQEDLVADASSRTATARFVITPSTGGTHTGFVRLVPSDDLPLDDARAFVLNAEDPLPIVVVDGAPNADATKDGAFFLSTALAPPGLAQRQSLKLTLSPCDEFERMDLSPFRVVLLVNVPELSEETWNKLAVFVEAGGGLCAFLGDQVRPARWNIDPCCALTRVILDDAPTKNVQVKLCIADRSHPVMAQFELGKNGGIENPVTSAYLQVRPVQQQPPSLVMTWTDGGRAMVEAQRGKGRVAVFTTSVDTSWTDFPRNACFVPFLHQLVKRLAGLQGAATEFVAGDVATVAMDPAAQHASPTLYGPGHQKVRTLSVEPGSFTVTFPETDEPGAYEVMYEHDQQVRKKAVAVNLDPRGADLTRADVKALAARAEGIDVETSPPPMRFVAGAGGAVERSLAGPLLLVVAGLLAAELLLAGRQTA